VSDTRHRTQAPMILDLERVSPAPLPLQGGCQPTRPTCTLIHETSTSSQATRELIMVEVSKLHSHPPSMKLTPTHDSSSMSS